MTDQDHCRNLLARWAVFAERDWYDLSGAAGLGCYGTGYNAWGVQTNQKYVGALAALAMLSPDGSGVDRQWARDRALAALRFSLASHRTGPGTCTDGTPWGNTWISALGLERMMFGVGLIEPVLVDADRDALRRVLTDEADWLLLHHQKGPHKGVFGHPWNESGRNVPESNLWNGALLWRAAVMYPDHPHAADWQEQAHCFLLNAVSVAADADDARLVAGRPVRERHAGANFFPHFALDHHGYMNVGYMVICLSNAALLHFDLQAAGRPRPESLDHHQEDLWRVTRRMVFDDGRLARIGGDTRVRYAYCQDYLLPALLYACDRFGDAHAPELARNLIALMAAEADANGDGSFFGTRLARLRSANPYYYVRLESDRAMVLAFALAYAPRLTPPALADSSAASVNGVWSEPEHGDVLARGPRRLASFAWRAHGYAQGLCLPPGDGHLAEWMQNLGGRIRCLGDRGAIEHGQSRHRRLLDHHVRAFEGGFLTWGVVAEGMDLTLEEGWSGSHALAHHLVFAALPDDRTVVGIQYCRNGPQRVLMAEVKGLLLNVPNDLFNGFRRSLVTAPGRRVLRSPARQDGIEPLGSPWAVVDGRLGVLGLYGAPELAISRSAQRRGGRYASLYVEELCYPVRIGPWAAPPGEVLLDAGWAVVASVGAARMRAFAAANAAPVLPGLSSRVRAVCVTACDRRRYLLAFNASEAAVSVPGRAWLAAGARALELGGERVWAADESLALPPGEAILLRWSDHPVPEPLARRGIACRRPRIGRGISLPTRP